MKKSKLDSPHIKAEVIKRIAVGESQSRIAGDVGLHRSQVSRFARREDIKPFIEQEQLKLLEAVPDAVENLRGLVRGMKNIPAKETKRRELAYKASNDLLKAVGIMPAQTQAPLIKNIYNDNRLIISPIVMELLSKHCNQVLNLDSNDIDILNGGDEVGDE
jgi:uncharacterized protein YjiS (DUF1127 family)